MQQHTESKIYNYAIDKTYVNYFVYFYVFSANMKAFDHIMTLTNGGPGYASNVLALYAYNVSFQQFNMGYGSAVSVFILVVTAVLFVISRCRPWSAEGGNNMERTDV